MTHRADFELAQQASRADAAAFQRLFGETFDRVHAFVARRSASREVAERVTERVLARAFAALGRYDGSLPFAAWVLALVKQELRAEASGARAAIRPSGPTAPPPGSAV
jgi:DNA-directed RNA polymerase specialized sigma24 family protein